MTYFSSALYKRQRICYAKTAFCAFCVAAHDSAEALPETNKQTNKQTRRGKKSEIIKMWWCRRNIFRYMGEQVQYTCMQG